MVWDQNILGGYLEEEFIGVKIILRKNLKCKLIGGASMFNFSDTRLISDIGKRNSIKVREVLLKEKIEIISEDVFGTKIRTITINTSTGETFVKTVGEEVKII